MPIITTTFRLGSFARDSVRIAMTSPILSSFMQGIVAQKTSGCLRTLLTCKTDGWRNIPITLIDGCSGCSGILREPNGPCVKIGPENSGSCFGKDGVVLGKTKENFFWQGILRKVKPRVAGVC